MCTLGPISGGNRFHHCALVYMSDLYILNAPARLFSVKVSYGQDDRVVGDDKPRIIGNLADSDIKYIATLSHAIHLPSPLDFRADEWMYIEVCSDWAKDGRVLARSRFYTRGGVLIASCVQEVSVPYNALRKMC
jgi:acyl-CoA thioesterase